MSAQPVIHGLANRQPMTVSNFFTWDSASKTLRVVGSVQADRSVSTVTDLTTSAAVELDFSATALQALELSSDTEFATAHRVAGASLKLVVTAGDAKRSLTWPDWRWATSAPTQLASGAEAILTLICLGTAETDVVATWSLSAGSGTVVASGPTQLVDGYRQYLFEDEVWRTFWPYLQNGIPVVSWTETPPAGGPVERVGVDGYRQYYFEDGTWRTFWPVLQSGIPVLAWGQPGGPGGPAEQFLDGRFRYLFEDNFWRTFWPRLEAGNPVIVWGPVPEDPEIAPPQEAAGPPERLYNGARQYRFEDGFWRTFWPVMTDGQPSITWGDPIA